MSFDIASKRVFGHRKRNASLNWKVPQGSRLPFKRLTVKMGATRKYERTSHQMVTPWLSSEFEMLAFGKGGGGLPLVLFPTDGVGMPKSNFNSPYEYLSNMPDPWKYNHMAITIGTGEWDVTRDESHRLSAVLNSKGIKHWSDDGKWRGHDWNYGQDILPYYLSLL